MKSASRAFVYSLTAAIGAALAQPAAAAEQVEGVLSLITATEVKIGDFQSFRFNPRAAQCFDFRGDRTTCETLIAVGYADKARITVVNGLVTRVDIIELQQ